VRNIQEIIKRKEFVMKILRVNTTNLKTTYEDLPADWKILGGRGLSAKIMKAEVPAQSDPLGPEAKLIIASGALAGTLAPSCGRTSVGAKSPLTQGIKEANAGGPVGQDLDKLGIRAIVLEGRPKEDKLYILSITKDGARLKDGEAYRGLKTYALADTLRKEYQNKISVISIGPVGERKSKGATVTFTDKDGHCSRHAARGGLGAVMMAKGLKAIVIDDQGAPAIEYADRN
jgi:aldehyde:ferredoxin oxidoreductase